MKKEVLHKISEAEDQWLEKLERFLADIFRDIFLPSHDLSHHIRTWRAAKKILLEIAEFNVSLSAEFIEAVLLASFFHDTGLTETKGVMHGEKGKNIYLKFVAENCQKKPAMHEKIATAIELHDQKTKNQFVPFHWDKTPDLLTVVSMADDMDALGTIGIYRYAEIYLHRSIPMQSLGMVLLENVSTRYNNYTKSCSLIPSLVKFTRPRYQEIITFYDNYNQQLLTVKDPLKEFSGHIGIVNYIRNFSVIGKIPPSDFPLALKNFNVSKYVMDFFTKLKKNLDGI